MRIELVVIESTGIYWKSPYATLEAAGVKTLVVNAKHVKNVPGRKALIAGADIQAILLLRLRSRVSFSPF